ncbi:serine acetyltransferase [Aminipila terrae]|uniref:Serine acetyltransferase n=2 Tax=Aminipila terrae TaxID=2697030 RepID=A0A6P1M9K1_9FIRM|nr:serine acetyltransferase [Aminipila terrae]
MNIYKWYQAERWLYLHHVPILPMMIKGLIRVLFAAVIPYQCKIGQGTLIGYQGLGVVIHKKCVLGSNCHISQNVTLGGKSGKQEVPVIGDNVTIGTGAVIIGSIHIGNNVIIGANAVVLADIPDNAVVVGVPSKIIKYIER